MKCNQCKRRVADNPKSKIKHVVKYHPERVLLGIGKLFLAPILTRQLGETLGDKLKERLTNGKTS